MCCATKAMPSLPALNQTLLFDPMHNWPIGKVIERFKYFRISGSCWKIRMTQDFILVCGEEGGEPCEVSTTLDFPNVTFHNLLLLRYKWNLTVQSSWTASKPSSPASLGLNIETLPHRSCLPLLNIFWDESLSIELYIGDNLWAQLTRFIQSVVYNRLS